jgi:integrase
VTLGNVADRYLAAKIWAPRTREQNTFCLNEHWKPLRNRPLSAIRRVDVAARLQEISGERGRKAARVARSVLSAMFRWGMGEGLCDHNPVVGTNDPAVGSKSRERVLDDSESKAVYDVCPDDDFGRIVKVLQFTGLRRDEAGGLRWDEINFDAGLLTIPDTRTKNHRTFVLPLPERVLNILRSVPRHNGACVFGDPNNGFHSWSHHKKLLDARLAGASTPLTDWRLHDLRRTFRTGLGRLGVPPHVAELCINHVRKGMSAIYDRHTYQPEIASALAQWAEHLTAVVEGRKAKIVPLRA